MRQAGSTIHAALVALLATALLAGLYAVARVSERHLLLSRRKGRVI